MLRCAELGLSDETLSSIDIGMVYDLLIEKSNDTVEYPYRATVEDLRDFFG